MRERLRIFPAGAGDQAALDELCRAQNRRDGSSYGPPALYSITEDGILPNPNVPLALVAAGEDGAVRMVGLFERQLELMTFGGGARETRLLLEKLPEAMLLLEQQGYEGFHVRVAEGFWGQWERSLAGRMRMRLDSGLRHYYRPFRGAQ